MDYNNGLTLDSSGIEVWRKDGMRHRTNGPAMRHPGGREEWYFEGARHREKGPAYTSEDGDKFWYKNGMLHNDNGPAVIYANKTEYYYLNDNYLTKEKWEEQRIKAADKSSLGFILALAAGGLAMQGWANYKQQAIKQEENYAF